LKMQRSDKMKRIKYKEAILYDNKNREISRGSSKALLAYLFKYGQKKWWVRDERGYRIFMIGG